MSAPIFGSSRANRIAINVMNEKNFVPPVAQPKPATNRISRISRTAENALALAVLALLLCLILIFAVAVGRVDAQAQASAMPAAATMPRWITALIVASFVASVLVLAAVMMASIIEESERVVEKLRGLPVVIMPAALKERLKRRVDEDRRGEE